VVWCLVRRGRSPEETAADALLAPAEDSGEGEGEGAGKEGGKERLEEGVVTWVREAELRAWHDHHAAAAAAAAAVPGAGGSKMKKKAAAAAAPPLVPAVAPLALPPTVQEALRAEAARAAEAAAAQVQHLCRT